MSAISGFAADGESYDNGQRAFNASDGAGNRFKRRSYQCSSGGALGAIFREFLDGDLLEPARLQEVLY